MLRQAKHQVKSFERHCLTIFIPALCVIFLIVDDFRKSIELTIIPVTENRRVILFPIDVGPDSELILTLV